MHQCNLFVEKHAYIFYIYTKIKIKIKIKHEIEISSFFKLRGSMYGTGIGSHSATR